jgi:hypothetical protein
MSSPCEKTDALNFGNVMHDVAALTIVKVVHTIAWAFFAACILAIPIAAWSGDFRLALGLISTVFVEVLILAANSRSCPLTKVAARYTNDRRDNFDIYLPLWLARYNKQIFGGIYAAGMLFTLIKWLGYCAPSFSR